MNFISISTKNGKVRFTDNLANVPADQRRDVEEYESTVTEKNIETMRSQPSESRDTPNGSQKAGDDTTQTEGEQDDGLDALGKRLQREGEALKEEYNALMEERAQLEEKAARRLTPVAQRALLKKIKEFNVRIRDYEKRRDGHNQSVEDYEISGN